MATALLSYCRVVYRVDTPTATQSQLPSYPPTMGSTTLAALTVLLCSTRSAAPPADPVTGLADGAVLRRQNGTCPAGETFCEYRGWSGLWEEGCVDKQSDYLNCGDCNHSCETPSRSDMLCVGGQCICINSGKPDCGLRDQICPDPKTSRANCGGCGRQVSDLHGPLTCAVRRGRDLRPGPMCGLSH